MTTHIAGFALGQTVREFDAVCARASGTVDSAKGGARICPVLPVSYAPMGFAVGHFCDGKLCAVYLFPNMPTAALTYRERNSQYVDVADSLSRKYGDPTWNNFDNVPKGAAESCPTRDIDMRLEWNWGNPNAQIVLSYTCTRKTPDLFFVSYSSAAYLAKLQHERQVEEDNR